MDQLFSSDEEVDFIEGQDAHSESPVPSRTDPIDLNKMNAMDFAKLDLEDLKLTERMKKARKELKEQKQVKSANEVGEINFQRSITECGRAVDEMKHLILDIPTKLTNLSSKDAVFDLVDLLTEQLKKIDKSLTLARRNHDSAIAQ